MSCRIAQFIRFGAIVAWLAAAVDLLPIAWDLSDKASLFIVAAACVLSYAWIARVHSQPAVELYLAGKDIGRREALLEQQCANVERISSPSLRVVSNGH